VISFSRLRRGQPHPVHAYRIKPGNYKLPGVSSGNTIDRSAALHMPLIVGLSVKYLPQWKILSSPTVITVVKKTDNILRNNCILLYFFLILPNYYKSRIFL
jgi:hypothetical protein